MLSPNIDLTSDGVRHGMLPLIHSDHRHAHSVIPIPITVICRGSGPTVLITAGVHGDEFAGILAARQLIAELPDQDVCGRIIVMPQLNLPACRANARVSPLDDQNLNRVFPGAATGAPTAQIAHYVEEGLLPDVDFAIDLHSGGTTARYVPSAFLYRRKGAVMAAKSAAAAAFGLPVTLVVDAPMSAGSLLGACDRKEVPAIACEVAGGITLDQQAIAATREAVYRVLQHLGALTQLPPEVAPAKPTRFVRLAFGASNAVIAPASGGLIPLCDPGDIVEAGEAAALLYPMEDQSLPPKALTFPKSGMVTSVIARAEVRAGDMICLIGEPEGDLRSD
ncbi:MAG: succinylglutamate desuccinylase/aspartoacylase family protein [Pseudomonadota bacterium]